jgi:hypothetical protein
MARVEDILGPAPQAKPSVVDLLGPPPVETLLGPKPAAAAAPKPPASSVPQRPAPAAPPQQLAAQATPPAPKPRSQLWGGQMGADAWDRLKGDAGLAYGKPSPETLAEEKKMPAGGPRAAAAERIGGDLYGLAAAPLSEGFRKLGIDKESSEFLGGVAPMAIDPALKGVGATGRAAMGTKLGRELHATVSPGTVSDTARAASALHREVLGKRGLEADQEIYRLAPHAKALAEKTPEQRAAFVDYVENRSRGAKLGDPKLQKAADALRDLSGRYRSRIEYVLGADGPTFIKDYYAHLWKQNPAEVEAAMARGSRQGSGSNLRARKIPTYADGLAAGLEPRFANPVDAMTAYTENMARFLGTHDIRQGMVKQGLAKWARPGQQPEGWVPLKGAGVERVPKAEGPRGSKPTVADILGEGEAKADPMEGRRTDKVKLSRSKATKRDRPVDKQVLYAPADAGRIYNNYISQGMSRSSAYQAVHGALNGLTQLKLGLSTFHAAVMSQEGIVSEVAKGFQQAARGKVGEAAKTIGSAPAAPVKTAMRGHQMFKELMGESAPTKENARLNEMWARSGGRLRMDKIYGTRGAGSFYNALKRGTLKGELKDTARGLYSGPALSRAQASIDLVGNVIQSTAAPLFEEYIPMMKRGAWASRMSDWMKANPDATEAQVLAKGRDFLDNIDNRFGELIVDNNFWNKTAYQVSQLMLLSPSWNIGTVREIGGGILNVPKSVRLATKGEGIDDKTAYVAALAATTMVQNAVMTKIKTGQNPEGMDFFAYRTGGKNPDGSDERAMIPGYMKDVMAFTMNDPRQEVVNKLNPGVKAMAELWNNKDYRGLPIYPEKGVQTAPGDKGLGSYLGEQAAPISVGNFLEGRKAGSNISPAESAAAIRPASSYMQDPARHDALRSKNAQREWQRKRKADARAASRLEKTK